MRGSPGGSWWESSLLIMKGELSHRDCVLSGAMGENIDLDHMAMLYSAMPGYLEC